MTHDSSDVLVILYAYIKTPNIEESFVTYSIPYLKELDIKVIEINGYLLNETSSVVELCCLPDINDITNDN